MEANTIKVVCETAGIDWIQIVTAFLLALAAAGGVVISSIQVRIKVQEYKYNLFEKRMSTYKAIQKISVKLYLCSRDKGKLSLLDVLNFNQEVENGSLLFSKKIKDRLDKAVEGSIELAALNSEEEDYKKSAQRLHDEINKITDAMQRELKPAESPAPRWLRWLVGE